MNRCNMNELIFITCTLGYEVKLQILQNNRLSKNFAASGNIPYYFNFLVFSLFFFI